MLNLNETARGVHMASIQSGVLKLQTRGLYKVCSVPVKELKVRGKKSGVQQVAAEESPAPKPESALKKGCEWGSGSTYTPKTNREKKTQEAEKFSLFSKAGEFEVLSSSPNLGLASFKKTKTVD